MKRRCCGSISCASLGVIEKKDASKCCAPLSMYAAGTKLGWSRTAAGTPLAASAAGEKSVSASCPEASRSQKPSTSSAPGKRPATPTIASLLEAAAAAAPAARLAASGASCLGTSTTGGSSSRARSRTVGASKRSNTVSDLPSDAETAATSFDAASEWPPMSKKLSVGETSSRSSTSAHTSASSGSSAAAVGGSSLAADERRAAAASISADERRDASASGGANLGKLLRSSFLASPPPATASSRVSVQCCGAAWCGSSLRAASRRDASQPLRSELACASAASVGSTCATSAVGCLVSSSSSGTTAARATPGSARTVAST